MLDLVRKHARSWLIKVALFLIVIVFIFWGGYSYKTRQEGQMARVGDHYISINEYNQYYNQLVERYRQQLRDSFSEDLLRQMNLKKQALNLLIDRYIVSKAAQDLRLTATSEEIQQKLLEFPVFQTEGRFDKKRYELILRQNRFTPETFEQQMGQDLTLQKVEAFVKRRVPVMEQELMAEFRLNNTLIQTAYLLVDPKALETQVKVDEKALEDFSTASFGRWWMKWSRSTCDVETCTRVSPGCAAPTPPANMNTFWRSLAREGGSAPVVIRKNPFSSAMTHGSKKKNFEIFTPEEFIAAITQHIPDKYFQMVRCYGWYSSRSRGERIKAGFFRPGDEPTSSAAGPEVTVLDVSDHRPRRVPSKTWRELIKKACARVGGYLGSGPSQLSPMR